VLRDTELARRHQLGEFQPVSMEAYAAMAADFLERLDARTVIHRLTGEGPASLMLAPSWGRDKTRILAEIERTLAEGDGWQGKRA
jgi:radical SAM superfamily enzyme